jgi:hypothetical protein
VKATKSFIVLFPPTQTTRIKAGYIKLISTPVFMQYNYILHDSLNTMIGKTSVSMMVLLVVVASLIDWNKQYISMYRRAGTTSWKTKTTTTTGKGQRYCRCSHK